MPGRTNLSVLVVVFLVVLLGVSGAHAMWPQNGAALNPALNDQFTPDIAGDGQGGSVIAWAEFRPGGTLQDILVQRLDAWGRPLWGANGLLVCTAFGNQEDPVVIGDGSGGAFVAWEDLRVGDFDLYVQHISAEGVALWTADGVPVVTVASGQYLPRLVRDAAGGVIMTWHDSRSLSNFDIYAQRVNSAGNPQWIANGVAVSNDVADELRPCIISDGAGGAIIAYEQMISFQFDIRAQRITSGGSKGWALPGVPVCSNGFKQDNVRIVSDGAAGAILVWRDYRNGVSLPATFAQRLTATGSTTWTLDGVDVNPATSAAEEEQQIVSDGANGAIVAWRDSRSGPEAYVQRLNFAGSLVWAGTGVLVSDDPSTIFNPRIAPDGIGGAVVSWIDYKFQSNGNFFARSVNANGTLASPTGGVPLELVPGIKIAGTMASDGAGGGVVAWTDYRNGFNSAAYAQRFDRFGNWGYPSAEIVDARDVPGDQGGVVNIEWNASRLDPWPSESIDRYTVWRAVDPTLAPVFVTAGAPMVTLEELDPLATDAMRVETLAGTTYYWQLVATVDAFYLGSYAQTVPTLFDSTATSPGNHYFQVIAHGLAPSEYWASAPASAKSVDNIAPNATLVLDAQRVGSDVHLLWTPRVTEADFNDYAVFRGTMAGVQPIPGLFITSTEDTVLVDTNPPAGFLYYIVTARDTHGNQGVPSNEASVTIPTAVGDTPSLARLTLGGNFPNPFSGDTVLRVGLPRNSDVRLDVFDAAGRRVATRDIPRLPAGWQRIAFNGRDGRGKALASGVYFGRITAAGETRTMKMVIQR
jgi:hypothetical protein